MSPEQLEPAEALFYLANERMENGDWNGAQKLLLQARELDPDLAEVHANLAYVQAAMGAAIQAEASYARALAIAPDMVQLHINLGTLLLEQKRLQEAISAFEQALALDSDCVAAWSNLGGLYASMHMDAQAETCCRTAMRLDPGHAKARFNLAYVLLRQGAWEEGWACFEARDWYAAMAARMPCPRWQGAGLAGRSILLVFEAGHGDVIQFCRYVPLLKRLGATNVALLCHPALVRLMHSVEGLDHVLSLDHPLPDDAPVRWDWWCPLLSLPFHLQTRVDSLPAALPYLRAEPKLVQLWREALPLKGPRVGLVWTGNPKFENDKDRSLSDWRVLQALLQVEGVTFISLQKGAGEGQALSAAAQAGVQALGHRMHDFADAAAIVSQLDLVVSVDTAMAHLAGALKVPCWVLLPHYKTDWRWLQARDDSPWYPGVMRLFRQGSDEDWSPVIAQLVTALQKWVHSTP